MKKIFLFFSSVVLCVISYSQYVYKIKADSVLITNDSCNAELILQNSTRNVCGFLFNKGNGRTEFRSALIKLNDSTYIVGCDTLRLHGGGGGGGGSITANNGLTMNPGTNVQLGGTGIQNTNIDWGNFTWTNTWNTLAGNTGLKLSSTSTAAAGNAQKLLEISLSGSNVNDNQSTYGLYVSNTHGGGPNVQTNYGIYSTGGIGTGVYGTGNAYGIYGSTTSPSGFGVYGYNPDPNSASTAAALYGASEGGAAGVFAHGGTGYGLFAETYGTGIGASATSRANYAGYFERQTTAGGNINIVYPTLSITAGRINSGTVLDGVGTSIDLNVVTKANTNRLSHSIISKWTDATDATRTSQFIIAGVNSAVTADLFTLNGNGQLQLNKYISSSVFTGTAVADLAVDASGNVITTTAGGGGNTSGTLIGIRVLTSGTSYTPTTGTASISVQLIGGGGGGGGVTGINSNIGAGGGGGSGSYVVKYITGIGAGPYTYAIGAGGTAGANTGANGGNGGSTTLTIGATTYTAPGGSGGVGQTAGTAAAIVLGGNGGTSGTNGDVNGAGTPGSTGLRLSGTVGSSGAGASSILGGGANGLNTAGAGNAAISFGSGGSGGLSTNTTARTGGAGSAGVIIIYEYR